MRTIQFREAICEAMSEEMRRDESIYLMGEEVAEYNGAYKVTQGMLAEFGPKRVIDTPITELGFADTDDPGGVDVLADDGEAAPVRASVHDRLPRSEHGRRDRGRGRCWPRRSSDAGRGR